ncbi:MAG: type IV pilus secretin PilQ [Thiotrichales bacterium]|nr:type IV pilus secretin PilQ [Thiotrichales bacterium]
MSKQLFTRGLFFILALVSINVSAQSALEGISFSALPGDRVQIKLDLDTPQTAEPLNFTIDNPARIALDFPNTILNTSNRNISVGVGVAHSVSAVEAAGRTRVVLNLVESVPYDIKTEGNSVMVTLGAKVVAAASSGSFAAGPRYHSSSSVDNIDFRRGDQGEGRILVTLSDPSIGVDIGQEGGKIVIDFLDTNLPDQLDRKLDVIDFATPVKEIDTAPYGNGARMLISTINDEYDHLVYQSDNLLTIDIKPLTKAEQEQLKKEKFGYTGERLSLNFQNIQVRAVLQLIADFTGFNMVASDSVSGNVTLRLKNVPWDQALDIILKARGLGMRKTGNVVMVAPQEELAAREKLELEAEKQLEELAPLRTEFMQINYAKATDLATLISTEENDLLSDRGNVSIDERTNTLIVQDVAPSLESIRGLIARLDIPVKQVLIESRIVNASESFSRDLGVRFGYSKDTSQNNDRNGGQNQGTDSFAAIGGGLAGTTDVGGQTFLTQNDNENLLVDLPVAGATGSVGLLVGKVGTWLLQLELNAAEAEGRTENIANPKVITANQREAVIESGVEIPFQQATSSGATSVSFKKAVLSLRVTPQITPDDRILLDLSVNQDARGSPDVLGVPPIDTRNVSTQVLVDNGETVVLGGVYTQEDTNNIDRVPFFGDLPYVGFLFKRTAIDKTKNELLIFVTPKILKDNFQI